MNTGVQKKSTLYYIIDPAIQMKIKVGEERHSTKSFSQKISCMRINTSETKTTV